MVGQQTAHIVEADEQGGGIDQRVALHLLGLPDTLVHHQLHGMLAIAHHGEQGDRTRGEAEHCLEPFGGAKAQPLDPEPCRQRLEIDPALLRTYHQKQPLAFRIAQKEVLGLGSGQVGQQPARLLAGENGGMIDTLVGDGEPIQQGIDCHSDSFRRRSAVIKGLMGMTTGSSLPV